MVRKQNGRSILVATAVIAGLLYSVATAEPTLKAGDKAPAISVEKWFKGEPVTSFEPGKVYVVEFWATWCGPCIKQIPHMTALQKEYRDKGVTMIAVTSKDNRGNTFEKAEKFVAKKGDGMGYIVAWDKDRETNAAFMKAAERPGIPCCFVVDQESKIAWVGHPMWLDTVLESVVAKEWDIASGPDKIAAAETELRSIFATAATDPKAALAMFEKFETAHPGAGQTFQSQKYRLALDADEPDRAKEIGTKIVSRAVEQKNEGTLNGFAWDIVDPNTRLKSQDVDLALLAAQKASELTDHSDAPILDTLARAHFLKGNVDKAVELQRKAVSLVPENQKASYQKALDEYLAAKTES